MLPPELMIPIGSTEVSVTEVLRRIEWGDDLSYRINENDNLVVLYYSVDQRFNFKIPTVTSEEFTSIIRRDIVTDVDWVLNPGIFDEIFEIEVDIDADERISGVLLHSFDVELSVTASGGVDLSQIRFVTILDENVTQMDYVGTAADGITREPRPVNGGKVEDHTSRFSGTSGSAMLRYENIRVEPTAENTLPLGVRIAVDYPVAIPAGSTISYEYRVVDLEWTVLYGEFSPARRVGDHSETHDFDLSDFDGFRFVDPRITVNIESNVGTTFEFWIDYIEAFHSSDPTGTAVRAVFNNASTGNVDSESTHIAISNRPRYPWSEMIQAGIGPFNRIDGRTNLLFDQDITPNRMKYEYSVAHFNAPGDHNTPHFLTHNAGLNLKAVAELPLWVRNRRPGEERGYRHSETITGMNLPHELRDVPHDALEEVRLELRIRNGFATDVSFEITEFLDGDENKIDVPGFPKTYEIDAPPIVASGTQRGSVDHAAVGVQILRIELTGEQFEKIRLADQMTFNLIVDLKDGESPMRVTPQDFFGVQVGVYVKSNLDSSIINAFD